MKRYFRKENNKYGNRTKTKGRSCSFRAHTGSRCRKNQRIRQTISNWENEKSYPDIISVIELSNLYCISLDDLLKGDSKMIEHLEESTNVVKSNKKLIGAISLNIVVVILLITLNMFLPNNSYYLILVFCIAIISSATLLYQIIKHI